MRRIHQVASLLFLALGIFFVVQGHRLHLEGQYGPGPGFFPFGIGIGVAAVSLAWLVQASTRSSPALPPDLLPPPSRRAVLLAIVLALVGFMLLLRPVGFDLSMLCLLLFLFFAIDRKHASAKVIIAIAGSFGVHYAFEQLLRIPLPYASLPLLRSLGL